MNKVYYYLTTLLIVATSFYLLYLVPTLWTYANEAKTSHMSSFWMGLLTLDILQGGFTFYVFLPALKFW